MVGDNLKLAAIFWMGCVFAFQLQPFANICQRKRADDGELFPFIGQNSKTVQPLSLFR